MPYLFETFPTISFDVKKTLKFEVMTNIMLRFKINDIIKRKRAEYFLYSIEDGERPDVLAYKIYEDSSLDWLIFLTNNIIDPYYDWPLSQHDFTAHIKKKYGNIAAAQGEIYGYNKILNNQSRLYDGTVLPKRTVAVDSATYATLASTAREQLSMYDYELQRNEEKRNIKLIEGKYIGSILSQIESIFDEDE